MTTDPLASDPAAFTPDTAPFTHRQILVIFSGLMLGMLLAALDRPSSPPPSRRSPANWGGSTTSPGW